MLAVIIHHDVVGLSNVVNDDQPSIDEEEESSFCCVASTTTCTDDDDEQIIFLLLLLLPNIRCCKSYSISIVLAISQRSNNIINILRTVINCSMPLRLVLLL